MISLLSKRALVSLGIAVAFLACGKTRQEQRNVVADTPSAGKAGEASAAGSGGKGGVEISIAPPAGDSGGSGGSGGMPEPPPVDCGADDEIAGAAGASEECASPPSVCGTGRTLIYYSAGVCIEGTCRWTATTLDCPESCRNGACATSTTEK